MRGRSAVAERATPYADARAGLRHVFIRDLRIDAHIGVGEDERALAQPLVLQLDLAVRERPHGDDIDKVVCYATITRKVQALIAEGPVKLVETLAERIADLCLEDARIRLIRIEIAKPEAIAIAGAVGVAIERISPHGEP